MRKRRSHPLLLIGLTVAGVATLIAPDSMIRDSWALISAANRKITLALADLPKSASQLEVPRIETAHHKNQKLAAVGRMKHQLRRVFRRWALPLRHEMKHLVFATIVSPRALVPEKPLQTDPPAKPQIANLQPLGFVEWANGTREGILDGPQGIETVRKGDVLRNRRILAVSPFGIEYATVAPNPKRTTTWMQGRVQLASNSPMPNHDMKPTRNSNQRAKSLGFVELAAGQRMIIFANGSSVELHTSEPEENRDVEWAENRSKAPLDRARVSDGENRRSISPLFHARRKAPWLADIEWANGEKERAFAVGGEVQLFPIHKVLAANSNIPAHPRAQSVAEQLSIVHSSPTVADLWPRNHSPRAWRLEAELGRRPDDPFDPRATFVDQSDSILGATPSKRNRTRRSATNH